MRGLPSQWRRKDEAHERLGAEVPFDSRYFADAKAGASVDREALDNGFKSCRAEVEIVRADTNGAVDNSHGHTVAPEVGGDLLAANGVVIRVAVGTREVVKDIGRDEDYELIVRTLDSTSTKSNISPDCLAGMVPLCERCGKRD